MIQQHKQLILDFLPNQQQFNQMPGSFGSQNEQSMSMGSFGPPHQQPGAELSQGSGAAPPAPDVLNSPTTPMPMQMLRNRRNMEPFSTSGRGTNICVKSKLVKYYYFQLTVGVTWLTTVSSVPG